MAPSGDLWVIRRTRHRKVCTTPGLFCLFSAFCGTRARYRFGVGIPFSLIFQGKRMTSCTTTGHVNVCTSWCGHRRGHTTAKSGKITLVWHNYETKGRGDLLSRPKNRDAELRMIPRKSSAAPVTFANSPRPCSYGHAMHDQPAGLTAVPRRQAARSASGSLQAQK